MKRAMKQKSTLEDFETARIDLETSVTKRGGDTSVSSGRNTATSAKDHDCTRYDCDNDPNEDLATI
jgi:hypothetical protein